MITNLHSTILLICGLSGSGKDTFAKFLASAEDVKHGLPAVHIVTSYTNRPMRTGETQGKEHMFVEGGPTPSISPQGGGLVDTVTSGLDGINIKPSLGEGLGRSLMAYCKYGNYEYWTFESQFRALPYAIYIVDEASLISMKRKSEQYLLRQQIQELHGWPLSWAFSVKTVLVRRRHIDVGKDRTSRDEKRDLAYIHFDYVIENDGTLEQLRNKAARLRNKIYRETAIGDNAD